jgi:hypothetical protein
MDCSVHGVQCAVCSVPGARCPVPGTLYSVLRYRRHMLHGKYRLHHTSSTDIMYLGHLYSSMLIRGN